MLLRTGALPRRRRLLGHSLTLLGIALLAFAAIGFAAPGRASSPQPLVIDDPTVTPDTAVPGNSSDGLSSTDGIATDSLVGEDGYTFDGTYIPDETLPPDSASVGTDVTYSDSVDSPTISSSTATTIQNIATGDSTVKADLHAAGYTVTDTSSWDVGTVLIGGVVTLTLTTPQSLMGTWTFESDNPGGSPPYTVTTSSNNYVSSATELDVFVDSSLGRVVAIEPVGASMSCVTSPGHFCPSSPTP